MTSQLRTSWQLWRTLRELLIAGSLVGVASLCVADADRPATMIAEGQAPGWEAAVPPGNTNSTYFSRWVAFDAEYGIHEPSHSFVGRMLQNAKHGLDQMSFEAQEAARRFEFTYDIGQPPPTGLDIFTPEPQYDVPLLGTFGPAQLKSEVTVHDPQTGAAAIYLKLVIPFGRTGQRHLQAKPTPPHQGQ